MRPTPIKKIPAVSGTTTHVDLINKINEIIDCLNYLTDPRTPPNPVPRFRGTE